MGCVTATHLLEQVLSTTLVMNNPVSVRNSPEKVLVLDYREFMPPTLISRSIQEVGSLSMSRVSCNKPTR